MDFMTLRRFMLLFVLLSAIAMPLWAKEFTLVLDPGHGGHDYGAVGSITNEKSINLAVAKKFGEKVQAKFKDVKVVYTRSTDVFIPLNDRAKIANRNKGDLFVSIHVNSVDRRSKNRKTVAGAEVYTLGLHKSEENLAVAKRENSVMALEADFSETYKGFDPNSVESYIIFELSQSRHLDQSISFAVSVEEEMVRNAGRVRKGVKQAGFWVLWATGMPSVLVELDFICNPESERFLASEKGQNKLAQALFNAFSDYYCSIPANSGQYKIETGDDSDDTPAVNPQEDNPADSPSKAIGDSDLHYRIQILAHDTPVAIGSPEFKGIADIESYTDGNLYKYTVGRFNSFDEAKRNLGKVRKKFPQAFIIKMQNGMRVR